MRFKTIFAYTVLLGSILFLQFGPYNNPILSKALTQLKAKARLTEALRHEFVVLSVMDQRIFYPHSSALWDAVSEYLDNERNEELR
jgi:hypothetical protein